MCIIHVLYTCALYMCFIHVLYTCAFPGFDPACVPTERGNLLTLPQSALDLAVKNLKKYLLVGKT